MEQNLVLFTACLNLAIAIINLIVRLVSMREKKKNPHRRKR